MRLKEILDVWKKVFGSWRYTLLLIVVAFGFYLLNVVIANYGNLFTFYETTGLMGAFNFLFIAILGFGNLVPASTFYTIILLSVLTGMLISLLVYKYRIIKSTEIGGRKIGFFSSLGLFLGILVPGCASCGVGIAAVLGLTTSLAVLPLKGFEIPLLGAGILSFSIYKVTSGFFVKC